jgi:inhibitor of KinA
MSQQPADSRYTVYPVGDAAITVQWGEGIDERTNQVVLGLFQLLKDRAIPGVTDIIPAYNSLTLVYESEYIRTYMAVASAYDWIHGEILRSITDGKELPVAESRYVEIPVCYDTTLGPDLPALSLARNVPVEEVVIRHSRPVYRVYMIGFLPGFPYMGTVDAAIAAPRKKEPALHIAKGSVGIAGIQTGIYPLDSPGGWNIIGRTPVELFDPQATRPVYLNPGDRVKFIPISLEAYHGYTGY